MAIAIHPEFAARAKTPRYTFGEASVLTHRPTQTLRRWSIGNRRQHEGRPRVDLPLIEIDGSSARGEFPLSFLNLIELRFLASYRSRASLPAIRRALDYAARELQVERPLLELEFATHGRELFLRYAAESDEPYFVNASRHGQIAWPKAVDVLFESLEYDTSERAAYRWWPLGKATPVLIDTRLNSGLPSTAESGVRTDVISRRLRQGWEERDVAADLAATPSEVRAARELERVA